MNIVQSENYITLTVLNEPISWPDDPPEEAYEVDVVFKSNDNFNNSLIKEFDNKTVTLFF